VEENKIKAEAEAAAKKKVQQQLAVLSTNTNAAGRSRSQEATPAPAMPLKAPVVATATSIGENIQGASQKRTPPAVPSRAPVSAAAAAAMSMKPKPKPPAAASTANAGDEQFKQEPPAPARGNLLDQLFAYAKSVRAFVYGSRPTAERFGSAANAKNGVAGDTSPTDDEKAGRRLA
jgi:hypothetical protein